MASVSIFRLAKNGQPFFTYFLLKRYQIYSKLHGDFLFDVQADF